MKSNKRNDKKKATKEGIEAFISDPEAIRMRKEAGVDTDSQEVVSAVSEYHIFQN